MEFRLARSKLTVLLISQKLKAIWAKIFQKFSTVVDIEWSDVGGLTLYCGMHSPDDIMLQPGIVYHVYLWFKTKVDAIQ